jgi:hypothetical protein
MDNNPIGPGKFGDDGRGHGIGLFSSPGLSESGHVVYIY